MRDEQGNLPEIEIKKLCKGSYMFGKRKIFCGFVAGD